MTEVSAALIWEGARFMICQRPAHKARGLLWEFPGGKQEPGESPEEALARECREELGTEVEVGGLFMEVVHAYPDLTVRLRLYHCRVTGGPVRRLEHADIRFITAGESGDYAFCPADEAILKKLRRAAPVTLLPLKEPRLEELLPLYEAVGWSNYTREPERLLRAFRGSLWTLGAFSLADGRLVGLLRAVGDGAAAVCIQDLLLLPEWQRRGVGSALLSAALARFEGVYQLFLLTDDTEKTRAFYRSQGLSPIEDAGCRAFWRVRTAAPGSASSND